MHNTGDNQWVEKECQGLKERGPAKPLTYVTVTKPALHLSQYSHMCVMMITHTKPDKKRKKIFFGNELEHCSMQNRFNGLTHKDKSLKNQNKCGITLGHAN